MGELLVRSLWQSKCIWLNVEEGTTASITELVVILNHLGIKHL